MSLNKNDPNYVNRKMCSLKAQKTQLKFKLKCYNNKTDKEINGLKYDLECVEKHIEELMKYKTKKNVKNQIVDESLPFGKMNDIGFKTAKVIKK